MATAVTIQIRVDGSQAGQAIDQINAGLAEIGIKGSASVQQAGNALDKLGGHAASNLDSVRLLSQEFGLRLPRALEAMISRVPALTSAISGALGAIASIAVVEVLVRAGEAVYNLFEKYLDVGAAARKYNEEVTKAQDADFGNTHSIEDTTLRIQLATRELREYKKTADELNKTPTLQSLTGGSFGIVGGLVNLGLDKFHARQAADLAVESQKQLDQLNRVQKAEQEHALNLLNIDAAHASDSRLVGEQKITAELKKQQEINAENRRFTAQTDAAYGNRVDDNSGAAREDAENRIARGKAAAEENQLRQTQSLAIMKSQHEIIEANLQGEALYYQKLLDDTEELKARLTQAGNAAEIPAAVAAANAKYFADMSQRVVDLQNKTALAIARSQIDAMPEGPAKFDAERWRQVNENNINLTGDDRAAANQAAAAEAQQKTQRFNDEAAKKEADRIAQINDLETQYAKDAAEAQRRVKQEGITGWTSDYKDAIASIQAQDAEQTARLDKQRTDLKLTDQQYAQAKVNIDAQANAQIAAQNQQMQHQIASTLQSAFTDPIGFIKSKMEQMFFDILANWIMQLGLFKSVFGTTLGSVQPGAPGGSQTGAAASGGILGSILRGSAPWSHSSAPIPTQDDGPSSPPVLHRPDGSVVDIPGAASIPGFGGASSFSGGGWTGTGASIPGYGGGSSSGTASIPTFPGGSGSGGIGTAQMQQQASTALGFGAAAMGAYEVGRGTYDAFRTGNAGRGALSDAMGGAAIGMAFGGPIGAILGGSAGALLGGTAGLIGHLTGEAGNLQAREYYRKTLFPAIEAERNGLGSSNFQTAIANINKTTSDGMVYMAQHYGSNAAAWVYANYLHKEQNLADSEIQRRAQGGGSYVQMSAAQFHSGGTITGFGDLATSGTEGFIHAMLGEKVANPWASAVHGSTIDAMNAGATPSDIASRYLAASSRPSSAGASAAGGDTHNWTINAMDARSFQHFLRNGGAKQIVKETNMRSTHYAGDGISG